MQVAAVAVVELVLVAADTVLQLVQMLDDAAVMFS